MGEDLIKCLENIKMMRQTWNRLEVIEEEGELEIALRRRRRRREAKGATLARKKIKKL